MSHEEGSFEASATESEDGSWRVVASGELDVATADRLVAALEPVFHNPPANVTLDLHDVTFIDSSGLRAVVRSAAMVQDTGGRLVLDRMSPTVSRVLEVTGLLETLSGEAEAATFGPG